MQDLTNSEQSNVETIIHLMDKIEYDSANYAKNTDTRLKNINENLIGFQKTATQEIDMIKTIQNQHHEEFRQLQMTVARLSNELAVIRKSKKCIK